MKKSKSVFGPITPEQYVANANPEGCNQFKPCSGPEVHEAAKKLQEKLRKEMPDDAGIKSPEYLGLQASRSGSYNSNNILERIERGKKNPRAEMKKSELREAHSGALAFHKEALKHLKKVDTDTSKKLQEYHKQAVEEHSREMEAAGGAPMVKKFYGGKTKIRTAAQSRDMARENKKAVEEED